METILENIKKRLLLKSKSDFDFNKERINNIFLITEEFITIEEKNGMEMWLEYFIDVNFNKYNFFIVEEIIEQDFFSIRMKKILDKTYDQFIFNIIIKCAKLDIFENNLEYIEDDFVYKISTLKKNIKAIIKHEIQ
jgi:hypothetical protein